MNMRWEKILVVFEVYLIIMIISCNVGERYVTHNYIKDSGYLDISEDVVLDVRDDADTDVGIRENFFSCLWKGDVKPLYSDNDGVVLRKDNSLVKLDKNGRVLWEKVYAYKDESGEYHYLGRITSVTGTGDGGYMLVGSFTISLNPYYRGIYFLKLRSNGDIEWVRLMKSFYIMVIL